MTSSPIVYKALERVIGDISNACHVGLGAANLQISGGNDVEDFLVSIAVCGGSGFNISCESEHNRRFRIIDVAGRWGSRVDQRDAGCVDYMNDPRPRPIHLVKRRI